MHNFSAGPAVLPRAVLEKAHSELLDYGNTGSSVMEFSHRGPEFEDILKRCQISLRQLLNLPENYKTLFIQGGATAQFSAIVYNLIGSNPGDLKNRTLDYVVNGAWSEKGVKEAKHLGAKVNVVVNTKSTNHDGSLPPPTKENWKFTKDASFVFYTDNETIHGVEFAATTDSKSTESEFPFHLVPEGVPVVCDMSSNILSRPFDVTKFGLIFAGAQKNMGPSGVTLVIVREDLLKKATVDTPIPTILDYKIYAENDSMYNTPPTWSIYLCGLVYDWLLDIGGLHGIGKINESKAKRLYDAIDCSNGFYRCPVNEKYRSKMNVPFRLYGSDGKPSEQLEKLFLKGAEAINMVQLKGHRSVGGLRASLYNALEESSVVVLVDFMKEFAKEH
ncbi:hypothetical protein HK096_000209, partial [Nowakowskiella sp. JEL0078]